MLFRSYRYFQRWAAIGGDEASVVFGLGLVYFQDADMMKRFWDNLLLYLPVGVTAGSVEIDDLASPSDRYFT